MNTVSKIALATKVPAYAFAFAALLGLAATGSAFANDMNGIAVPDDASHFEHLHADMSGPGVTTIASAEATNGVGAADDVPVYEHRHSSGHSHNPNDDGDQYLPGD